MGKTPTIKVDLEKKCIRCGEAGACENGYCMKCTAELMTEEPIGERTLEAIKIQVEELFETYRNKINQAAKRNGNELDISFKVGLKVFSGGTVYVQTGIDFTSEKIKDKTETATVQEIQQELPLDNQE